MEEEDFTSHFRRSFGRSGNPEARKAKERKAGRTDGERKRAKGDELRSVQFNSRVTPHAKSQLVAMARKLTDAARKADADAREISQADVLIMAIDHYAKTVAKLTNEDFDI